MAGKRTIKGRIVLEALDKFPDVASHTIASKIYKENPEIFTDKEAARRIVRYYRGISGDKSRKELAMKDHKKFWEETNTYTEEEKYHPYTLPAAENNILLLSDIHIPYQDNEALKAAIEYGKSENVNTIILNGDILDFYTISSFIKAPNKPSIKTELDLCRAFLKSLRDEFPSARIYYKEGNHEERWYKYLMLKAPEILDLQIMELDDVIGMTGFGITPIKDKRMMKAGKLNIIHGHELKVGNGVNPARALYLKSKVNTICGHLHRTSEHIEPNLNGETIGCWSTGCLSTLFAEYAPKPYNKWNHGFAHIKIDKDKNFTVANHVIIDGKIK